MDPQPWERFLASSANPRVPTIGEAISQSLTAEEARLLSDISVRPWNKE